MKTNHAFHNHPALETFTGAHMRTSRGFFILTVLALALGVFLSSACNTVRGIGRDVENTGDHIQQSTR